MLQVFFERILLKFEENILEIQTKLTLDNVGTQKIELYTNLC